MKARTFVAIMIVAGAIGVGARWWQNEVSRPQGPAAPSAAEADEQGVPFDDVLYTVEAMLAYADVDVAELIDREAAETRALPCMLGVTQQAGIALP